MFKKEFKILLFLFFVFSPSIFANPFVDVYGTNEETANKIIEKFGNDIHEASQRIVSTAGKKSTIKLDLELSETKKNPIRD